MSRCALLLVLVAGCAGGMPLRQAATHPWWDKPVTEQRVAEIVDQIVQVERDGSATVRSDGTLYVPPVEDARKWRMIHRAAPGAYPEPSDGPLLIRFDMLHYPARPSHEQVLRDLLARMDEGMAAKSWRQK